MRRVVENVDKKGNITRIVYNIPRTGCTCGRCGTAQRPHVPKPAMLITADEWERRAAEYAGQALNDALTNERRTMLRQMADDSRYLAKIARERQEREALKSGLAAVNRADYTTGIVLP